MDKYFIQHLVRLDSPEKVDIDESAFVQRKFNVGNQVYFQ